MNVAYSAIKFFYSKTCPRYWKTLKNLRVQRELKLPTVINVDEVRLLRNSVPKFSMFVFFTTVYPCSLGNLSSEVRSEQERQRAATGGITSEFAKDFKAFRRAPNSS